MSVTDNKPEYALIGHPLAHSLSPFIHNELMRLAGLESEYGLLDIETQSFLQEMPRLLANYRGLNITIPYKQRIISMLDSLDSQAAGLKSVNTVLNSRGYNTDREGFLNDGPALYGRSVLILGAGGVSRMLAFAAAGERAARIMVWARRSEQSASLIDELAAKFPGIHIKQLTEPERLEGGQWVLLNGTPAGMWPHTGLMPLEDRIMKAILSKTAEVYDTIYNPVSTRLVLLARSMNIPAKGGLGMLFGQALAAQRIWHPQADFPENGLKLLRDSLVKAVYDHFPISIIFTGFMGSGKSTVGKLLAEHMNLELTDLDTVIEQTEGKSISEIFSENGENVFREIESKQLEICLQPGCSRVLSTGGGALISEYNQSLIRKYPALVVYLDCPLPEIRRRVGQGQSRPLWKNEHESQLQKLYDQRKNVYYSAADRIISAEREPEQLAAVLAADFGYGGKK
jgi:shikimate dehydrogenase